MADVGTTRPRARSLRDYYGPNDPATPLFDYAGPMTGEAKVRLGDRIVALNNNTLDSIAGTPSNIGDSFAVLADKDQRRLMLRGLVKEEYLNNRRRNALFTSMLMALVLLWGSVSILLLFLNTTALGFYQSGWGLFLYSVGTSLFLPTPFELILAQSVEELGLVLTIFIASIAKVFGAYLVLLIGDRASGSVDRMSEGNGIGARVFRGMKAFAKKFGYFAIFIFFAIPFMSDTAPLFLFSVMRLNKSLLLGTIFIAIVIRSILYLVVLDLIGL